MGLFILGIIIGIMVSTYTIKKGYIKLKVKRRKSKLPKDLEIGRK